jgi:hypothetical protein
LANPDGGAVVHRRDGFEWGAEAPEAWWRVAVERGPWCLGVGLVPHRLGIPVKTSTWTGT